MIYLDTSALLKLLREAEHSAAFRAFLAQRQQPAVSSVKRQRTVTIARLSRRRRR